MTDIALQNAERQRDELLARRNALRDELSLVEGRLAAADAFIYQWHAFADDTPLEGQGSATGMIATQAIATGATTPTILPAVPNKRRNSKKEDVAAAARQLIETAGSPMTRSDLFKRLEERGLVMDGSDPEMVLSTMLWRAGEAAGVARLKKGGYWLSEKDWPEAGYFPSLAPLVADLLADTPAEERKPLEPNPNLPDDQRE